MYSHSLFKSIQQLPIAGPKALIAWQKAYKKKNIFSDNYEQSEITFSSRIHLSDRKNDLLTTFTAQPHEIILHDIRNGNRLWRADCNNLRYGLQERPLKVSQTGLVVFSFRRNRKQFVYGIAHIF